MSELATVVEMRPALTAREILARRRRRRGRVRFLVSPSSLETVPGRLRVAVSPDLGSFPVDDEVAGAVQSVAARMRDLGWDVAEDALALERPIELYLRLLHRGLTPSGARGSGAAG